VNRRSWIALLSACFAVTAANWAFAGSEKLPEPNPKQTKITEGTYGDDEVVSLLAELVDDPDTITRVWAVEHLGQTRNLAALPHIRKALTDDKLIVRAGAVSAAGKIGFAEAHDIILSALDSDEPEMLFTAMRTVQSLDLAKAADKVSGLLSFDDPDVRAMALKTLTHLAVAAKPAALEKLVCDKSTGVRLAAIENAMLGSQVDQIVDELLTAAGEDNPPGVRSKALELLGKFAFSRAHRLVSAAGRDDNPLVRRGAVRAYHSAGQGRQAVAFLDDPSAMVRLAAIKATGDMKIAEKTDKLFQLLFDAKDDMTRQAAREALANIGTEEVVNTAAQALPKWGEMPPPSETSPSGPSLDQIQANTVSCCWLLGKLKSPVALDYQLSLLAKRDVVSPMLLVEVPALAEMGDPRAIEPLTKLLARCGNRAKAWLNAITGSRTPPPYEPEIPRRIMLALARLKGYGGVKTIMAVGKYRSRGRRLDAWSRTAIEVLPELMTDENRKSIERFIIAAIPASSGLELTARFHAIKTAVKLNLHSAVPAILDILHKERPGWTMIHTAAWALQELTGQTPDVPQPRLKQGRDWVVRKIVD